MAEEEIIADNETKVFVEDLKIGMYVSKLDKDWSESSFWFQGFLVENEKLLVQLKTECEYVYINSEYVEKSKKPLKAKKKDSFFNFLFEKNNDSEIIVRRKKTTDLASIIEGKPSNKVIVPPKRMFSCQVEMKAAKLAQIEVYKMLKDFNETIRHQKTVDMSVARKAIENCMHSLLRAPDALILINRLKTNRYNTWQHSINVSILAMALGRYLNINNEELVILGLCGLFHDIGELVISKKELSESTHKKELLRSHTLLGRDILQNCNDEIVDIIIDVAYSHHERIDGSGYPRGLQDEQISAYAQIIGMVDLYDTIITDKTEKQGKTHYEAMTKLLQQTNLKFNINLVNSFNQCIGTYPIGSVVEMNTGELAVIVEDNRVEKLRPTIMLVTTKDKEKCNKKMIDLFETRTLDNGKHYTIKAIVRADSYDLTL